MRQIIWIGEWRAFKAFTALFEQCGPQGIAQGIITPKVGDYVSAPFSIHGYDRDWVLGLSLPKGLCFSEPKGCDNHIFDVVAM